MAEDDERPEIDSREALEAWLADKPAEWAQVIAVRTALRVFPLVLDVLADESNPLSDRHRVGLVSSAFKSAFFNWAILRYDDQRFYTNAPSFAAETRNIGATIGAESWAGVSQIRYALNSLGYSLYSLGFSGLGAHDFSIYAMVDAAAAEASARKSNLANDLWRAVERDFDFLSHSRKDVADLVSLPLWFSFYEPSGSIVPEPPAPWADAVLERFLNSKWVDESIWKMVADWYCALLTDQLRSAQQSYFGRVCDTKIGTMPREFWAVSPQRTVEDVLRDIERIRDGKPTVFTAVASSGEGDAVGGLAGDDDLADGEVLRTDAVPTHLDEPTTDDQLGRRPFARALVERIEEVRNTSGRDGFALHLHAPWGAGKTSVLLMMQEMLRKPEESGTPWAVVQFNAWEHEHRKPPWWPLIQALKDGCHTCLDTNRMWLAAEDVNFAWRRWILRAELVPYLLLLVVVLVLYSVLFASGVNMKDIFAALAALTVVLSAGIVTVRWLFFGSIENFKFYSDISRDPMARVNELFRDLAGSVELPICVFIDDLDRCNADYVVDLLEGIQSSMRHPNVTYVVAADRAWLRSSFEQRYSNFSGHVGNAGQPLGYLFLEKIFQVSTPVPGMGDMKQRYWDGLLAGTFASGDDRSSEEAEDENLDRQKKSSEARAADFDEDVREKRNALRREFGRNLVEEDVREQLRKTKDRAKLAAMVLELTASPAQYKKIEHLLSSYADRLPDNPRVMKRMINTYAMRRAIGYLEGNPVDYKVLARWTILEQRFPTLADLLIEHPGWADMLADGDMKVIDMPQALQPFASDKDVVKVLGAPGDEHPLREKDIATITRGSTS